MITKHFFSTLVIFAGMILLGLAGIFIVSYFNKAEEVAKTPAPTEAKAPATPVPKTCKKGLVC